MRVAFHSSHVNRDYSDGRLAADIVRTAQPGGEVQHDQVHFAVPPDYHVHNDCVAAALMTLVGETCPAVNFNFPISERCADVLTAFYRLEAVGPVDRALEPRRPGRYIAINFSGGVDSTALYLLMQEVLGRDFKAVSYDFGGRFRRERTNFELFHRDVTCRTNLRSRGFNRHGRFLASLPLLYADYLDLRSVASGHTLHNERSTIASAIDGADLDYRRQDGAYRAGGLAEEHFMRGLASTGAIRIILDRAPERLETALAASAGRGSEKYYTRAIWSKHIFERVGLPLPGWLTSLKPPAANWQHPPGQRFSMFTLWAAKYAGMDEARRVTPEIDQYDLSFLDDVSLAFISKYNTNVTSLLPPDLSPAILRAFHGHDLYPYTERDWHELGVVRRAMHETPPPGPLPREERGSRND